MAFEQSDLPPCSREAYDAVVGGTEAMVAAAIRRCRKDAVAPSVWEPVAFQLEHTLLARIANGAVSRAEAVSFANRLRTFIRTVIWEPSYPDGDGDTQGSLSDLQGRIILATLPGDAHDVGRYLWHALLSRRGVVLEDLGVRAPALVASHAAEGNVDAIGIPVFSDDARQAVQSLVANLLRRGLKVPLLIGGPGVDATYAQWVAIPGGGEPYWGGVYYCEDGAELLQVLKQIVLFKPPPVTHSHDHNHTSQEDIPPEVCESCAACPMVGGCDLPQPS